MYIAYYLERSDGDGDLCAVVNNTDISEELSDELQSTVEKIISKDGTCYQVTDDKCKFPDVWEFPKAQITDELLQQFEDLIQYVWEDEEAHWEEAGRPDNHIFVKIKKVNDWLADMTKADVRSLTKRVPDGATRAAQSGSISGKRSASSPRR